MIEEATPFSFSLEDARLFRHHAMGTLFEISIQHDEYDYAKQSAEAAFDELDRLESELSRFIPSSDISRLNALQAGESVRVGLETFDCLSQCADLYVQTYGAFDITIGSLYACWLDEHKKLRNPSSDEIKLAKQQMGMKHLRLDTNEHCVQALCNGLIVDLGGFGKGYALDRIADILRDWEVNRALIHGGKSTALALDAPVGSKGWPVTLRHPDTNDVIQKDFLVCNAISGSGRQKGLHIIDPRTAAPAKQRKAAWVTTHSAATSDALSTALMIFDPDEIIVFCNHNSDVKTTFV